LAVPVLEQYQQYLERVRPRVSLKGPEAVAVGYALSNWEALCRHAQDGDLEIDYNAAERSRAAWRWADATGRFSAAMEAGGPRRC
jgi:transposase